jgi:hypothetical protein
MSGPYHATITEKLFIVGLPRSGTSTLVHTLRSVGFGGFAEGHLLGLLPAIEQTISHYYNTWKGDDVPDTMLYRMDQQEIISTYRSYFRDIFERLIGPTPWVDKNASPSIMPHLELIQFIWNDASFIFTKRRPVDFIASAMKKFPNHTFEHFCETINFTFRCWEAQKGSLKKRLEIDQSELLEPDALGEKLVNFLGIDQNLTSAVVERLKYQVEKTSSSYLPRKLSDLNLTPGQVAFFNEKCGSLMQEYQSG